MILHGGDFSGADSGGAAKIRVVDRNMRARGEPVHLRGRFDRKTLLRQMLETAREPGEHQWRIDAPFSLPIETLDAFKIPHDWMAMARWMANFGSPRGWRHDIRTVHRKEPKRACDRAESTPMAPMNLRVFKQTWTLIAEVLLPLAEAGVHIEPLVHRSPASRMVVYEGCPSSILQRFGWPAKGYKGEGAPPREVRASIVERLPSVGVSMHASLAREAIDDAEGDLLDAILLTTAPTQTVVPAEASIEAWVY
jgi:hypothetical protein